jgi:hypothetical protein
MDDETNKRMQPHSRLDSPYHANHPREVHRRGGISRWSEGLIVLGDAKCEARPLPLMLLPMNPNLEK